MSVIYLGIIICILNIWIYDIHTFTTLIPYRALTFRLILLNLHIHQGQKKHSCQIALNACINPMVFRLSRLQLVSPGHILYGRR
jgi:hypothetical protein